MNISVGCPRIIVAGVASGVGKTTIATGLMAALAARELRVQGYKVGPDYIDPTYHRAATGRPSYNLDSWLSSPALVRQRFEAGMRNADIALIEGVMGLFDGRKQTRDTASTAEIARLLNAPVVLVIDVSHMGQSVAAVVHGFQQLDPDVRLAGVILNKVASGDHEATLRYAIAEWTGVPVLGAIRRDTSLLIPGRHLGLIPAAEAAIEIQKIGRVIEEFADVDELLRVARAAGSLLPTMEEEYVGEIAALSGKLDLPSARIRIGLALDMAFSFYYPEMLEILADMGGEIVPFSPLQDNKLPEDVDLLYFGGGFPEVFAGQLAENTGMLAEVRAAVQRGIPVYAECGGYMYLGKTCVDTNGRGHSLVGVLPYTFRMGTERAQMGYREITMLRDTLIAPAGTCLRGHEFHWSRVVEPLLEEHAAYRVEGRDVRWEGYASETLLASYIHIPLAANPRALERLLHVGLLCRQRHKSA
jgi:cobyrinic acid a,c-diamide synthase